MLAAAPHPSALRPRQEPLKELRASDSPRAAMDLSHLVTIGLMPARRAPLTDADHDYFQKHGVERLLAELVNELAAKKPADPCRYIADKVAPLAGKGGAAASAPAAAPKAAPAAAPAAAPKTEGKKEGKKGGGGGGKKEKSEALVAAKNPSKGGGVDVKKMDDVPLWYEQVVMKAATRRKRPRP